MKMLIQQWFETQWYQNPTPNSCLKFLSQLFMLIAKCRRFLYQTGWLKQVKLPVPVIVVGNLTVGGTGKSPMVVYLAELLHHAGYNPGIISRGYGGKSANAPHRVFANSDPNDMGDEAVMLASKTACPVAVGSRRGEAAMQLLTETDCDVIISDDGLQHYALQRDIEIVVIDGERRFGNGYCLPAGPLRETEARLKNVDFQIVNGTPLNEHEFVLNIQAEYAVNCHTGAQRPLTSFYGEKVNAVAGIGNPQRFFDLLGKMGIDYTPKAFPDHFQYQASDIHFGDHLNILMTEKDAVKCRHFATPQLWFVPIQAELSANLNQQLLQLLHEKRHGS